MLNTVLIAIAILAFDAEGAVESRLDAAMTYIIIIGLFSHAVTYQMDVASNVISMPLAPLRSAAGHSR